MARAQDTTGVGAIAGTITKQGRGAAAAVAVCVTETSQCAVSDADGSFQIPDVRSGAYRLEITPPGGAPIRSEPVIVRAGLAGRAEVTLPSLGGFEQTVTVTAPAFVAPEEIKNSAFLIQQTEILTNASALQDISRYVQTLPGVVVGTNDFRNDIIVRGGSPLENLFVVDNIEIPNINTFANFASAGGIVSILDANLIQDVTFPRRTASGSSTSRALTTSAWAAATTPRTSKTRSTPSTSGTEGSDRPPVCTGSACSARDRWACSA